MTLSTIGMAWNGLGGPEFQSLSGLSSASQAAFLYTPCVSEDVLLADATQGAFQSIVSRTPALSASYPLPGEVGRHVELQQARGYALRPLSQAVCYVPGLGLDLKLHFVRLTLRHFGAQMLSSFRSQDGPFAGGAAH